MIIIATTIRTTVNALVAYHFFFILLYVCHTPLREIMIRELPLHAPMSLTIAGNKGIMNSLGSSSCNSSGNSSPSLDLRINSISFLVLFFMLLISGREVLTVLPDI